MTKRSETIETIQTLRAMGARRVVVDGIEVEWPSGPAPVSAVAERVKPEEAARAARESDEAVMFAACG